MFIRNGLVKGGSYSGGEWYSSEYDIKATGKTLEELEDKRQSLTDLYTTEGHKLDFGFSSGDTKVLWNQILVTPTLQKEDFEIVYVYKHGECVWSGKRVPKDFQSYTQETVFEEAKWLKSIEAHTKIVLESLRKDLGWEDLTLNLTKQFALLAGLKELESFAYVQVLKEMRKFQPVIDEIRKDLIM